MYFMKYSLQSNEIMHYILRYIVVYEFSEYLSSWRINYLSWRNAKYPKLIIKYEDLKDNSFDNFKKILKFIKIQAPHNYEVENAKFRFR